MINTLFLVDMSRIRIFLSFLGFSVSVIAVAAAGFYARKQHITTIAEANFLSPTPSQAQNTLATLTKESGIIQYKLPNEEQFRTLDKDEEKIPTGTSVMTGKESLGHVIFPDNSLMSLSENTQVVVNYADKQIKIVQLLGNTWHRVTKVLQGNSYSVETPNTLATVRGTEFNVAVLPNKRSEVMVKESIVDVSKIERKEDGQVVVQDTKRVEHDKQVVIAETPKTSSGSAPTLVTLKVEAIPEEKKQTTWFQRNVEITEEIKTAEKEVLTTISPEQVLPTTGQQIQSPDQSGPTKSADEMSIDAPLTQPTDETITVTPILDQDAVKTDAIGKTMKRLRRNRKLKEIDTNPILEKNDEKVMKEFSEALVTPSLANSQVQGASTMPVWLENVENTIAASVPIETVMPTLQPVEPTVIIENQNDNNGTGGNGFVPEEIIQSNNNGSPTHEPIIREEIPASPTREAEPEQTSPSPEVTEEPKTEPPVEEHKEEDKSWIQSTVEKIQEIFASDAPPQTPIQE